VRIATLPLPDWLLKVVVPILKLQRISYTLANRKRLHAVTTIQSEDYELGKLGFNRFLINGRWGALRFY